jgi:FSR family fosmidomycin resistance protein-like MFS transporter
MLGFGIGIGGLGVGVMGLMAEHLGLPFVIHMLVWFPLLAGLFGLSLERKVMSQPY